MTYSKKLEKNHVIEQIQDILNTCTSRKEKQYVIKDFRHEMKRLKITEMEVMI